MSKIQKLRPVVFLILMIFLSGFEEAVNAQANDPNYRDHISNIDGHYDPKIDNSNNTNYDVDTDEDGNIINRKYSINFKKHPHLVDHGLGIPTNACDAFGWCGQRTPSRSSAYSSPSTRNSSTGGDKYYQRDEGDYVDPSTGIRYDKGY